VLGAWRRRPAGTAPANSGGSSGSGGLEGAVGWRASSGGTAGAAATPDGTAPPDLSAQGLLSGTEIIIHEIHEGTGGPREGAGVPGGPKAGTTPALPPVWARWRTWGGSVLVALCFTLFGWQAWRGRQPAPVLVEPARGSAGGGAEIAVQVTGAVATPGVYRLTLGDRVDDAIRAAGGFAPGADPSRLNLAQRLRDEQRLDVPFAPTPSPIAVDSPEHGASSAPAGTGAPDLAPSPIPRPSTTPRPAQAPRPSATPRPAATPVPVTGAPTERVNVNTATAAQLEKLPGIGAASAKKIVDYRAAHGRLSSLDDLRRAGLSEAIVRRAADYLSFD
jgi:competence protein ComEA